MWLSQKKIQAQPSHLNRRHDLFQEKICPGSFFLASHDQSSFEFHAGLTFSDLCVLLNLLEVTYFHGEKISSDGKLAGIFGRFFVLFAAEVALLGSSGLKCLVSDLVCELERPISIQIFDTKRT